MAGVEQWNRKWRTLWCWSHVYVGWKTAQACARMIPQEKQEEYWQKKHNYFANLVWSNITELRGWWVKVGQFLSTRGDLLPAQYIQHLAKLQDMMPTSSINIVMNIIVNELGDVDDIFEYIEPKALASASIGQVHKAVLKTGEKVVVKIQHPDVEHLLVHDMNNLKQLSWAFGLLEPGMNFAPVLDEWQKAAAKELDFRYELQHQQRAYDASIRSGIDVIIPECYEHLTTKKVMVMKFIEGFKITDVASLEKYKVNRHDLMYKICDSFAYQIHIDGLFNGDPHPGNILVNITKIVNEKEKEKEKKEKEKKEEEKEEEKEEKEEKEEEEEYVTYHATPVILDWGLAKEFDPPAQIAFAKLVFSVASMDVMGLMEAFEEMGFKFKDNSVIDPEIYMDALRIAFRDSEKDKEETAELHNTASEAVEAAKKSGIKKQDIMQKNPLEDWPKDIIFFVRVASLLHGLCMQLEVNVPFLEIMVNRAKQCLFNRYVPPSPYIYTRLLADIKPRYYSNLERRLHILVCRLIKEEKILGCQVCIIKDDNLIVDLAAGKMGPTDTRPVTNHSLFCAYCAIKGVLTSALLKLVSEGEVDIHDKVCNWWDGFIRYKKKNISIKDVLTHRAGLHAAFPSDLTLSKLTDYHKMIRILEDAVPSNPAGILGRYAYLTYGWLVSEIVHSITNETIDVYIQREFLAPLKITDEFLFPVPKTPFRRSTRADFPSVNLLNSSMSMYKDADGNVSTGKFTPYPPHVFNRNAKTFIRCLKNNKGNKQINARKSSVESKKDEENELPTEKEKDIEKKEEEKLIFSDIKGTLEEEKKKEKEEEEKEEKEKEKETVVSSALSSVASPSVVTSAASSPLSPPLPSAGYSHMPLPPPSPHLTSSSYQSIPSIYLPSSPLASASVPPVSGGISSPSSPYVTNEDTSHLMRPSTLPPPPVPSGRRDSLSSSNSSALPPSYVNQVLLNNDRHVNNNTYNVNAFPETITLSPPCSSPPALYSPPPPSFSPPARVTLSSNPTLNEVVSRDREREEKDKKSNTYSRMAEYGDSVSPNSLLRYNFLQTEEEEGERAEGRKREEAKNINNGNNEDINNALDRSNKNEEVTPTTTTSSPLCPSSSLPVSPPAPFPRPPPPPPPAVPTSVQSAFHRSFSEVSPLYKSEDVSSSFSLARRSISASPTKNASKSNLRSFSSGGGNRPLRYNSFSGRYHQLGRKNTFTNTYTNRLLHSPTSSFVSASSSPSPVRIENFSSPIRSLSGSVDAWDDFFSGLANGASDKKTAYTLFPSASVPHLMSSATDKARRENDYERLHSFKKQGSGSIQSAISSPITRLGSLHLPNIRKDGGGGGEKEKKKEPLQSSYSSSSLSTTGGQNSLKKTFSLLSFSPPSPSPPPGIASHSLPPSPPSVLPASLPPSLTSSASSSSSFSSSLNQFSFLSRKLRNSAAELKCAAEYIFAKNKRDRGGKNARGRGGEDGRQNTGEKTTDEEENRKDRLPNDSLFGEEEEGKRYNEDREEGEGGIGLTEDGLYTVMEEPEYPISTSSTSPSEAALPSAEDDLLVFNQPRNYMDGTSDAYFYGRGEENKNNLNVINTFNREREEMEEDEEAEVESLLNAINKTGGGGGEKKIGERGGEKSKAGFHAADSFETEYNPSVTSSYFMSHCVPCKAMDNAIQTGTCYSTSPTGPPNRNSLQGGGGGGSSADAAAPINTYCGTALSRIGLSSSPPKSIVNRLNSSGSRSFGNRNMSFSRKASNANLGNLAARKSYAYIIDPTDPEYKTKFPPEVHIVDVHTPLCWRMASSRRQVQLSSISQKEVIEKLQKAKEFAKGKNTEKDAKNSNKKIHKKAKKKKKKKKTHKKENKYTKKGDISAKEENKKIVEKYEGKKNISEEEEEEDGGNSVDNDEDSTTDNSITSTTGKTKTKGGGGGGKRKDGSESKNRLSKDIHNHNMSGSNSIYNNNTGVSALELIQTKPHVMDPLIYDSKRIIHRFIPPTNARLNAKSLAIFYAAISNGLFIDKETLKKARKPYTYDNSVETLLLSGGGSRVWGLGYQLYECKIIQHNKTSRHIHKKYTQKKYNKNSQGEEKEEEEENESFLFTNPLYMTNNDNSSSKDDEKYYNNNENAYDTTSSPSFSSSSSSSEDTSISEREENIKHTTRSYEQNILSDGKRSFKKEERKEEKKRKKKKKKKLKKIVGYGHGDFGGSVCISFPEINLTISILVNDVITGPEASREILDFILPRFGLQPNWGKNVNYQEILELLTPSTD